MGTHYKGPDEEQRALDAFIKLVRSADTVSARVNAHLTDHGLTVSQFGALEALHHLGPMCQRALGQKLLKSGGNITLVVDNLEKRGLAKRVRDNSDRRMATIHLTEKGASLISELFPKHVRGVVSEMSALTQEEQETLGTLCRKLGRNESR